MIIGLGFQARSGKDTVGSYLCENHEFNGIAFADALKAGAKAIFGLNHAQLYGDQKEQIDPFWGDTPRNILQLMGTECMRRGYRDDIWVKCVERAVQSGGHWVVTDVRFPNEAEAIKMWGGYVVRVDRPLEAGRPEIATKLHASEVSMVGYDGWDHVIDNSDDLPHLYGEIEVMLNQLGSKHVALHADTID